MLPELPSIADAQTLMRRDKLRPLDLVEHCLGRIHQFEDQIHAWVMVDEEGARQEAQRLGKMLDDGHEPVGPLHGIPIGIKDIIDVAGWPTLCGSKLREGHVADKDAFVVANLRKAGAIILGKTVTTEWASFDPPPTRNPWNLSHTPGGSSSGSAAAVAMEMCMAALGTQTGGSIIRPASYCGVTGIKANHGYIPLDGIFPFSMHLDHVGPIARTTKDAYEIFSRLLFSHGSSSIGGLASHRIPERLFALRGGLVEQADAATRKNFEEVISRLSHRFEVIPLEIPAWFTEIPSLHRRIMAVEAADVHRAAFEGDAESYAPKIRSLIEEGRRCSTLDYAYALRRQKEFGEMAHQELHNLFAENCLPILLMPSTPTAAPSVDTTGDPIFNSLWSFLGQFAVTIPSGITSTGMPLGLQLTYCSWTGENALVPVTREIENFLGLDLRPPLLQA
ncbi:MAG: amidase [Pirellulaceae bacterium]